MCRVKGREGWLMEADNNPMLRDGLTGDWYALYAAIGNSF